MQKYTHRFLKPDGRLVGVLHPVEQARPARLDLLLDVVPVGSDQGDASCENNVQPDDTSRIDPVGVARQSSRDAPLYAHNVHVRQD